MVYAVAIPAAATTPRDIDLSVKLVFVGSIADLHDKIQAAAEIDLGDFLTFYIGELKSEIANAPKGGGRLPVEVVLVGKTYARNSARRERTITVSSPEH